MQKHGKIIRTYLWNQENAINRDDTVTDVNRLDVFGSGRDTNLQQSGLPARMVICLCNPGFLSWIF